MSSFPRMGYAQAPVRPPPPAFPGLHPRPPAFLVLLVLCVPPLFIACYGIRPTQGGGEISAKAAKSQRKIDPSDIALPKGYRIEAAATGLTYPTGVTFDDTGGVFVLESGYSYGEDWQEPRLIRVGPGKVLTTFAAGDSNGPWTGVTWHGGGDEPGGAFYVSEGGQIRGGSILKVTANGHGNGKKTVLFEGLPGFGDHHTNGPAIGPDGRIYFGQGTATNSGVVGLDNHDFGWLKRWPGFHDRPCADLVLAGVNYATPNPLTADKLDTAETGAFSPFGTRTLPGQTIEGGVPCNGAILRMPISGGQPEVVAWGFRNPFALAFSPEGKLYALDNGYDERGSRPVWGAADLLWKVEEGAWYGWPDYSGSRTVDRNEFKSPRLGSASLLLDKHPGTVPEPAAQLPVHSSADGIDFSTNPAFGHEGQAFVALFGDMAPKVGKTLEPVGFKVVRVDVAKGVVEEFAVNRKSPHGPASKEGSGGLERPISLRFAPGGASLYVVDFGVIRVTHKGVEPVPQTGVLWRIWKEEMP
ncbi:MAG TPA: glucose dehydrogenase [Fibrobacteria bacterium]|nr:glucose dehydrogenase [Fibrobacteria bacterium]